MTRGSGGCSAGISRTITQITATTQADFFSSLSDVKVGDELFFDTIGDTYGYYIYQGNVHCISNNGTSIVLVGTFAGRDGNKIGLARGITITENNITYSYIYDYTTSYPVWKEVSITMNTFTNVYKIIYT